MFNQSVMFESEVIELGHIGACSKCHRFKELVELYLWTLNGGRDVNVVCHRCLEDEIAA